MLGDRWKMMQIFHPKNQTIYTRDLKLKLGLKTAGKKWRWMTAAMVHPKLSPTLQRDTTKPTSSLRNTDHHPRPKTLQRPVNRSMTTRWLQEANRRSRYRHGSKTTDRL